MLPEILRVHSKLGAEGWELLELPEIPYHLRTHRVVGVYRKAGTYGLLVQLDDGRYCLVGTTSGEIITPE